MIIRRLNKDWSNYFFSLKEFSNGNPKGLTGKPSFPKPKKLSKVFNYSLPLEPSKFSLKNLNKVFWVLIQVRKCFILILVKILLIFKIKILII